MSSFSLNSSPQAAQVVELIHKDTTLVDPKYLGECIDHQRHLLFLIASQITELFLCRQIIVDHYNALVDNQHTLAVTQSGDNQLSKELEEGLQEYNDVCFINYLSMLISNISVALQYSDLSLVTWNNTEAFSGWVLYSIVVLST
jgi:hypothetical protein